MKHDPLYQLIRKSESIGLLCNQSGWRPGPGQYSFQWLQKQGHLKKVFIPEHGLFGELQDQVKLDDTSVYKQIAPGIEWISLYSSTNNSLAVTREQLNDIDTILIDIQDVGSRYYTFTTTVWLFLKKITELDSDITVVVIDKPNPAGRQVEGTRMNKQYASFIGLEGLPHRHGLTLAELCQYFKHILKGKWKLKVLPKKKDQLFIAPSPNIPSTATCQLYSGQCIWEGTNLSEGRGTTLPFSLVGSPFLNYAFSEDWNHPSHPAANKDCYIRPLRFIPVFHKYANESCEGIHLMPHGKKGYHSLSHSLQLVKFIKEKTTGFSWREGKYEAFNDKKAIELLVGDRLLLDYLDDKAHWKEVKTKLEEEEASWIKEASPFLMYKSPLQKLKLK